MKLSPTKLTPLNLISLSLVLSLLASITVIFLAMEIDRPLVPLAVENDQVVLTGALGSAPAGTPISALLSPAGRIELQPADFYEEPDFFPDYAGYNNFMARQDRMSAMLGAGNVALITRDQRLLPLPVITLPWYRLPGLFWIQLAVVNLCLLMGVSVWSFRRSDAPAAHYCLLGIGLAFVIFPAAVYSSRTLALAGETFRLLSLLDHFGLYLAIAAILALVWTFPRNLHDKVPFAPCAYGLLMLWWVLDSLQWLPSLDISTRYLAVGCLCLGIALLFMQWFRCAGNPRERVALKWFLMMIIIGAALFVFLVFIPPLLGQLPLMSQGVSFVVFLSIYISMAVGVARYRLFDLDGWWFEVWVWIGAGALVIILDLLLAAMLNMSLNQVSWAALALTGWAYFPARQWLMSRFLKLNRDTLKLHLPDIIKSIAGCDNTRQLVESWRHCLQQFFHPSSMAFLKAATISQTATLEQARQVLRHPPDLLITDLSLPDGRGHSLIPGLKAANPGVICVIFTSFDDNSYLFPALQAGADGYLLKDQPEEELIIQLTNILHAKPPLSPGIAHKLIHFFREPARESADLSLTRRERETLHLIAKGYSVKETAELLQLSHHTVADYIKKIYRKLQVNSRAEAAVIANRLGMF